MSGSKNHQWQFKYFCRAFYAMASIAGSYKICSIELYSQRLKEEACSTWNAKLLVLMREHPSTCPWANGFPSQGKHRGPLALSSDGRTFWVSGLNVCTAPACHPFFLPTFWMPLPSSALNAVS